LASAQLLRPHESVETTQIYLDANLALKEEILGKPARFNHARVATVLGIACSAFSKDCKAATASLTACILLTSIPVALR